MVLSRLVSTKGVKAAPRQEMAVTGELSNFVSQHRTAVAAYAH